MKWILVIVSVTCLALVCAETPSPESSEHIAEPTAHIDDQESKTQHKRGVSESESEQAQRKTGEIQEAQRKGGFLGKIPSYSHGHDIPIIRHSILKPFVVNFPSQSIPIGVKIPIKNPGIIHIKYPVVTGSKIPFHGSGSKLHPLAKPGWPTNCGQCQATHPVHKPVIPAPPTPLVPTSSANLPVNIVPAPVLTPVLPLLKPPVPFIKPLLPFHPPVFAPVPFAPIPAPLIPTHLVPVHHAPIHVPIQPAPVAIPIQPAPFAVPLQPAPVHHIPVQHAPIPVLPAPIAAPTVLRPGNSLHTSYFATFPKYPFVNSLPALVPQPQVVTNHIAPIGVAPIGVAPIERIPVNVGHIPFHVGKIPVPVAPVNIGQFPVNVGRIPIAPVNFGHFPINVGKIPITPVNVGQFPVNVGRIPIGPVSVGQFPLSVGKVPAARPPVVLNEIPTGGAEIPLNFGNVPFNFGPSAAGVVPSNTPLGTGQPPLFLNPGEQYPPESFVPESFVPDNSPFPPFAPGPQDQGNDIATAVQTPTPIGGNSWLPMPQPTPGNAFPTDHFPAQFIPQSETPLIQPQGTNPTVETEQNQGYVYPQAGKHQAFQDGRDIQEELRQRVQHEFLKAQQQFSQQQQQFQQQQESGDNGQSQIQQQQFLNQQRLELEENPQQDPQYDQQDIQQHSYQQFFDGQQQQQQFVSAQQQAAANPQHDPQLPQSLPTHPLSGRPISQAFHVNHGRRQRVRRPIENRDDYQ